MKISDRVTGIIISDNPVSKRITFHDQRHNTEEGGPTMTYEVAALDARLEVHLIFLQNRAIETQMLDGVPEPQFSVHCMFQ